MDVRICRKEKLMEYMRTQASIEKFVIITMRDGRKKYVGRRYSFKMDYGYTVKINEAMMFDTEKLAERKMEELRIKGQIGKGSSECGAERIHRRNTQASGRTERTSGGTSGGNEQKYEKYFQKPER